MEASNKLYIKVVDSQSEAENAGLKRGDAIIQFNGKQINGSLELFKSLLAEIDGQVSVPIQIMRENKLSQFMVTGGKLGLTVTEREEFLETKTDAITEGNQIPDKVDETGNFRTLLGFGKFISAVGWIIVVAGVITLLAAIGSGGEFGLVLGGAALLAIISGLSMAASGQVISCFVAIEKNTRLTNKLIEKMG